MTRDPTPSDAPAAALEVLVRVAHGGARPRAQEVEGLRRSGESPIAAAAAREAIVALLSGTEAATALRLARDTGILPRLVPELDDVVGFEQRSRYHAMTVDEHTFTVVDHAVRHGAPPATRLAALLHDSGKHEAAWGWLVDPEDPSLPPVAVHADAWVAAPVARRLPEDPHLHFYARPQRRDAAGVSHGTAAPSHEDVGAARTRRWLARLGVDDDLPVLLVQEHMYPDADGFAALSPGAKARRARRFVTRVGGRAVEPLLALREADRHGKGDAPSAAWVRDHDDFRTHVRRALASAAAPGRKDLAITGADLADLGIRGRAIGELLEQLVARVAADPAGNTRERLLGVARDTVASAR